MILILKNCVSPHAAEVQLLSRNTDSICSNLIVRKSRWKRGKKKTNKKHDLRAQISFIDLVGGFFASLLGRIISGRKEVFSLKTKN